MRFRITRATALGCVLALASVAQQQVTVDQLVQFITSSIQMKMADKDVASTLASMRVSQKLDPRVIEDLQGKGAGPKTVAALNRLSEMSASLAPPPPKLIAPKPKPIPPPSYEEQQSVLEEARNYALTYSQQLPDFICLQVTRRYLDRHYRPGAEGSWSISDRLAEKLTYFDQHEKYEAISHNDNSLYGKPADQLGGALSRGDFGTLLHSIFAPESDAEFHWERWGNLDGHLFYVYTYQIDQPHSRETLTFAREQEVTPGYHGEVFVEKGTNVIWRVTVEPEPPPSFPMQNIREVLDYRYTDISGQPFLLPASGTIVMRAEGVGSKNEIEFRSYRKYSADTSISFDDDAKDDKTAPAEGQQPTAQQPAAATPPK